jgi:hypothetical protein
VKRPLALASGLALVLCAGAARATPTARLVYSRSTDAESCPEETALRHAVAAQIGYDPFFAWATRTVVATLSRREGAFVASVDLVDEHGIAHGARELRSTGKCDELLDAVALTIAIAIDPQSLSHPAPAPPPPPPPVPPPPDPPSPAPFAQETRPPPAPTKGSTAAEASLGAVASTGVAPGPAVGLSLGADLRWRMVSLGLEGRVDAPAGKSAQAGGDVSAWLAVGSLVPCVYVGPVLACALAQAGSMQASGTGVLDARSRQIAWWAAGGRLGVLVPVAAGFSVRVRTDVVADLRPPTLYLEGAPAWPAPAVAVSLGADALLRFP